MKSTVRCLPVVFDSYVGLVYIKLRLIDKILIKDGPLYSWGSPAPLLPSPASVTYFQTRNDFPNTEHVVLAALTLSWNKVSHILACLFTNRRLSDRNNISIGDSLARARGRCCLSRRCEPAVPWKSILFISVVPRAIIRLRFQHVSRLLVVSQTGYKTRQKPD